MTHVRQLRKMVAVIVLAVMALTIGMGWTNSAALAAGDGSITINKATEGVRYDVYKILDMKYSGENNDKASYTVPDDANYKAIWKDMVGTYLLTENSGSLNSVLLDGTVYYLNITEENVAAFAMAFARAIAAVGGDGIAATASQKAESTTVEFTGLDIGYYLVVPDGGEMPVEGQAVPVNLTNTNPDADITAKGTTPSITKTVDEADNSADVGDTVTYTISGTVPGYVDNDEIVIYLHDKMDGLKLTGDYNLKVNGEDATESITTSLAGGVTATGDKADEVNGWLQNMKAPANGADEFTIGITGLNVGDKYVFTYSAIVDVEATTGIDAQNTNEATAIFAHDPDGFINTGSSDNPNPDITVDEVPIYVFDVNVNKIVAGTAEDDSTGDPLSGAKFVLYKENDGKKLYYYWNNEAGKVEWKDITTSTPADAAKEGTITAATSGEDGRCSFKGVQAGEYKLLEIEAPAGYNLLDDPVTVTFTTDPEGDFAGNSMSTSVVTVENSAGALLPGTGGMGTTLFYILGICLMAGAAVVFVKTRKNKDSGEA